MQLENIPGEEEAIMGGVSQLIEFGSLGWPLRTV